jgi:hypothetical protein
MFTYRAVNIYQDRPYFKPYRWDRQRIPDSFKTSEDGRDMMLLMVERKQANMQMIQNLRSRVTKYAGRYQNHSRDY